MKRSGVPLKETLLSAQAGEESSYRQQRFCLDMYHRALIGPVFYVLSYILVLAVSGYYYRCPVFTPLPLIAFLVLWWLRYRHRPLPIGSSDAIYRIWFTHQWTLVLVGAALWGVIAATVPFFERKPDTAVLVSLIATIAMSTAASQVFCMHPVPSRICMLALLLPTMLVCALPVVGLRSISMTLAVYSLYLMVNLQKYAQEYEQQIDLELELINSRAELARMSMMDGLTGLQNRLSYEQVWPLAWHGAVRKRESLALLVFDLDHFKAINDEYGHLVGDACLRHFAQILQIHARRDSDFVARIGGEEFIMMLPATALDVAQAMAEQLRQNLAAAPCNLDLLQINMTVSIGVGVVNWTGDTDPEITFDRVDHACYLAKSAGRNCVVLA